MNSSQSPVAGSYERYFCALLQSDEDVAHLDEPVQAAETLTASSTQEPNSLSENDTGAVVFDIGNLVGDHTDGSLPSDHFPQPAQAYQDVYVPMHRSQETRLGAAVSPDTASPGLSEDSEDPIDRRRKAKSKKKASLQNLALIRFTRELDLVSEDVEVASTNTKRKKPRIVAQEECEDHCHGSDELDGDRAVYRAEELAQSSQEEASLSTEYSITRSSAAAGQPNFKHRRGIGLFTVPETSRKAQVPSHSLATRRASRVVFSSREQAGSRYEQNQQKSLPELKPEKQNVQTSNNEVLNPNSRTTISRDNLSKFPYMTPIFDHSIPGSRRQSTSRRSTAGLQLSQGQNCRRPGRLFRGMVFAISFQAKKPDEKEDDYGKRMHSAGSLQVRIVQAGGSVENGFDELFELSPARSVIAPSSPPHAADGDVNLVPAARQLGFTALVADGHSRKEKYMQALALGLPCIAPRWITTCLDNGEIVDWAPYLLCAGQSAFLCGAYKSRTLAHYDASGAQLAHLIEVRPRLLDGSKILLVMKQSEEKSEQGEKTMKYVFLIRVLGATLCRVQSVNEAKEKVKASQDVGKPFDWVYASGKVDMTELIANIITGMKSAGARMKRKRGGDNTRPTSTAAHVSTKMRILTDELVIQSLILGRLIWEDAGEA